MIGILYLNEDGFYFHPNILSDVIIVIPHFTSRARGMDAVF